MSALESRAPWNIPVVPTANRLARIAWAVLSSGEDYRPVTAKVRVLEDLGAVPTGFFDTARAARRAAHGYCGAAQKSASKEGLFKGRSARACPCRPPLVVSGCVCFVRSARQTTTPLPLSNRVWPFPARFPELPQSLRHSGHRSSAIPPRGLCGDQN
jgi:hypothetical protein